MRRLGACLLFAACAAHAQVRVDPKTVQPPPESRWFNLDRSSSGWIAAGNLAGMLWAFHVRGVEMKRLGGPSSTTFSVDGAVLQVRAVPKTVIPNASPDALAAHKKFEQAYESKDNKATVEYGDHRLCDAAKVPHQEWTARSGGITQAVVTFEVGDYVLMVSSPYENEARQRAVARALGDVCATFQRHKA